MVSLCKKWLDFGNLRKAKERVSSKPVGMILMEKTNSSENPGQCDTGEVDNPDEEKSVALYTELTGASEAQARSVYMYSDIVRQRDLYCYHFA
jgi:hypothetical protein